MESMFRHLENLTYGELTPDTCMLRPVLRFTKYWIAYRLKLLACPPLSVTAYAGQDEGKSRNISKCRYYWSWFTRLIQRIGCQNLRSRSYYNAWFKYCLLYTSPS